MGGGILAGASSVYDVGGTWLTKHRPESAEFGDVIRHRDPTSRSEIESAWGACCSGSLVDCAGRSSQERLSLDLKPGLLPFNSTSLLKASLPIAGGTFGGRPTATGWLAATAAKGTLVGSANLCAGTSDCDWDNGDWERQQQQELHVHSNLGCLSGIVHIGVENKRLFGHC